MKEYYPIKLPMFSSYKCSKEGTGYIIALLSEAEKYWHEREEKEAADKFEECATEYLMKQEVFVKHQKTFEKIRRNLRIFRKKFMNYKF